MNTSEIYSKLILENIIKASLQKGIVPTLSEIEAEFNAIKASQDLDSSNFTKEEWSVQRKEPSSASKFNGMTNEIKQDLDVLYKSLFLSSERSISLSNRWKEKSSYLEGRLKDLESRIDRKLLVTQDTSGYFEAVGDRFTDTSLIDLSKSSNISINLEQNLITLDKTTSKLSSAFDRVFLNSLTSKQAVFTVLSQSGILSITNADNSEARFAFKDTSQIWKALVKTNSKISPLVAELSLKLDSEINISKIEMILNSSESNSVTTVTPLYSIDGINYLRVPSINTVVQGLDKISFMFPEITSKFIKFIFEKNSFDYTTGETFIYEFGAKEIKFFKESFSTDLVGTLISKPLSIRKPDGSPSLFNKIALKSCEAVTSQTFINYFITVAKDIDGVPYWNTINGFSPTIDISSVDQRVWQPISPFTRDSAIFTPVLDLSTISKREKSGISISFDSQAVELISPKASFELLSTSSGDVSYSTITATEQRYLFPNKNQKLLDLQFASDANIDFKTLKLWRNIGEKGLSSEDRESFVRGTLRGWEYKSPYYYSTILIKSSSGMTIDVGNNPISIDSSIYKSVIGPDILSPGTHTVRVHEDFWNDIEPELNTLAEIKLLDKLYPYNQKLLIEGYLYGSSYSTTEEKVYSGADLFASSLAMQVPISDLIHNVSASDYSKFSIDTDLPETSSVTGSKAIVVNTNPEIADFIHEEFMIEFNLTDELYGYLALKAEFKTENSQLSPILDEYIIKLGL